MAETSTSSKLIAEFIGTFFLALTICTAAVHGSAGDYAPFAIAATLMVMIYAVGHISGAHFNPAVTLLLNHQRFGVKALPSNSSRLWKIMSARNTPDGISRSSVVAERIKFRGLEPLPLQQHDLIICGIR